MYIEFRKTNQRSIEAVSNPSENAIFKLNTFLMRVSINWIQEMFMNYTRRYMKLNLIYTNEATKKYVNFSNKSNAMYILLGLLEVRS